MYKCWGIHKIACRGWLSSYTAKVPGIELWSPALVTNIFHCAFSPNLELRIETLVDEGIGKQAPIIGGGDSVSKAVTVYL